MKLSILLLAAFSTAAEPALSAVEAPIVDFDQARSSLGASLNKKPLFSMEAPKRVSDDGLVLKAAAFIKGETPVKSEPDEFAPKAFCGTERDCVDFIFEPQDDKTEYFPLRSTEYREECQQGPRGERNCWCRAQWTTNARVQIRLQDRAGNTPLPWERERFRMCLEGNWINYYEIATAFDYDAKFIDRSAVVVAAPRHKIAMRPDADGIRLQGFSYAGMDGNGGFGVTLADKWASYYAGETTVIKVVLKKKAFLGSRTLEEKELRVAPAAIYNVGFSGNYENGKYFVDWSFQRLGKTSTDKVIDKDDSSVIELPLKSAAAASR